jgi:alpha-methylacyl-CoA racemase
MGPLKGLRIIEFAGIGPGPFGAMMLADMGADVIRIDRLDGSGSPLPLEPRFDTMNRGRRSLELNLKDPRAVQVALRLCRVSDGLIEGFRPGVMERLGLGPEACLEANPQLVYGRMTGWGQQGPLADHAGHDTNYLALSGVLSMLGRSDSAPLPPLNLLADMGGGGMLLAFGIVCGLLEARQSGRGQVVDASMVEGSALLAVMFDGLRAAGYWRPQRESNLLDGGAPFYDVYETRDGKFLSVGAVEPQFYAILLDGMGLDPDEIPAQFDPRRWPDTKKRFREIFLQRTRDEWTEVFAGSDACVAPVLTPEEACNDPHNVSRGTFREVAGVRQAGPAPRFSRTPPAIAAPPPTAGAHSDEILAELGLDATEIGELRRVGAVA